MRNIRFCCSFPPWYCCNKLFSTKNLIAQQLQLCLFIIINRDENPPPEASKDFAI